MESKELMINHNKKKVKEKHVKVKLILNCLARGTNIGDRSLKWMQLKENRKYCVATIVQDAVRSGDSRCSTRGNSGSSGS